tara:strand:+ start:75 stop:1010 length:936 start_codon:yes stop_codon:yes gene_type:complete
LKKIGIIGINDGNGHPYSMSAMFNGYDSKSLDDLCPFKLIKEYLPRDHRNEFLINDAKVTHIWTQNEKESYKISKVSKIPNIVPNYLDLIGKVDAVIIARDDIENHFEYIKPFIEEKIPLFIDKQLVKTKGELISLTNMLDKNQLIFSASPMRYSRLLEDFKKYGQFSYKSVHGISRVNWIRYAHHLLEAICSIYGFDIEFVQSINSKKDHDIIQIRYNSGQNIILEFIKNISLPIQLNFYSEKKPPTSLEFGDFFYGFHKMMKSFSNMLHTGVMPIEMNEILSISKIVIAGQISIENNGLKISPKTLRSI